MEAFYCTVQESPYDKNVRKGCKKTMKIKKYVLPLLLLLTATAAFYFLEQGRSEREELEKQLEDTLDRLGKYEQLTEELQDVEWKETESGLYKKGGQYLIRHAGDLMLLAELVKEGREVESGISAAEASYRLTADIELDIYYTQENEYAVVGSKERPFQGLVDGEGHYISGYFLDIQQEDWRYLFECQEGSVVNLSVYNDLENHLDGDMIKALQKEPFTVDPASSSTVLKLTVENQEQCDALVEFLIEYYPKGSLEVTLTGADFDTTQLAWLIYGREDSESTVDVKWDSDEMPYSGLPESMKGFQVLLSERIMQETPAKMSAIEIDNLPEFTCFRKENVENLTCYSYYSERQGYASEPKNFYVYVEGTWNAVTETRVRQFLILPASEFLSSTWHYIETEDLNFDGIGDLMIHMGTSYGSGGSWGNYRGAVWNVQKAEFEYMPSLPEQISFFDRENEQIILQSRCGAGDIFVESFQVVHNEYKEAKRLQMLLDYKENNWELYDYEFGELKKTERLAEFEEVYELYPEFAGYWPKG